jgi:hypothetical protein
VLKANCTSQPQRRASSPSSSGEKTCQSNSSPVPVSSSSFTFRRPPDNEVRWQMSRPPRVNRDIRGLFSKNSRQRPKPVGAQCPSPRGSWLSCASIAPPRRRWARLSQHGWHPTEQGERAHAGMDAASGAGSGSIPRHLLAALDLRQCRIDSTRATTAPSPARSAPTAGPARHRWRAGRRR